MKFNKLAKTLSMTALTAAMAVAPAINVFAAPEDIIDTTKKASLTIHKYDMTAAQQDGINVDELSDWTGFVSILTKTTLPISSSP